MSVSASIKWGIHKKNAEISWVKIIECLLANGWSLNDNNMMTFLPLHDNDMFAWQREQINEEYLIKLLTDKEDAKESLGVCVTWEDSNIGGSLLTVGNNGMLLSLTINRKTIRLCEGQNVTDVNWYLLRVSSILSQMKDIVITSVDFTELV